MQSLQYATTGSQTIAVWPDTDPSFSTLAFNTYDLVIVNDYGQQSTTVDLTLQNIPTSVTPRLVFSLNKSELPSYTGNYTITLRETAGGALIWGTINQKWGEIQAKWSDNAFGGTPTPIDTDRAWISGSDVTSFIQYTSPDETGAYSIYHG